MPEPERIEQTKGFFSSAMRRVRAMADTAKNEAATAIKEKSAEIYEAIGPKKTEPIMVPERPFGRDEGGHDIKHVVWTGHMVETTEGQRFFGAAGLTKNGYYRSAEVQVYGSEELWRWENERHINKADAIDSAERKSADLSGALYEGGKPYWGADAALGPAWSIGPENTKDKQVAEIPNDVKAQADAAMAQTGAEKMPVQDMGETKGADAYDTRAMAAQRERQRQDALQDKAAEPVQQPDKG